MYGAMAIPVSAILVAVALSLPLLMVGNEPAASETAAAPYHGDGMGLANGAMTSQ